MIKRIVSGVLASLIAAGAVVGAGAIPASASESTRLTADVDAWRVTLQNGGKVGEEHGAVFVEKASVGENRTDNVFEVTQTRDSPQLYGSAEYQIVMLGEPTDYWIKASMYSSGAYHAECDVYSGAPSAGGTRAEPSPFACSATVHWMEAFDIRFMFHIELNRDAEASGTISTRHGLSLKDGTYQSYDLPYSVHGASSVDPVHPTAFDTVLREGDRVPEKFANRELIKNQARTEFAYQIYEGDRPTGYWVAGLSTNHRGAWFSGDGRCAIYLDNPLRDGKVLDDSQPILGRDSEHSCTADGSYKGGPRESGRGHFTTDFIVDLTYIPPSQPRVLTGGLSSRAEDLFR